MAHVTRTVSKVVTAQNQFTDPLSVGSGRKIGISITSTAVSATIVLQRAPAGSTDYVDIDSWTSNVQKVYESIGAWAYRLGVKTSGFTSATALNVSLST